MSKAVNICMSPASGRPKGRPYEDCAQPLLHHVHQHLRVGGFVLRHLRFAIGGCSVTQVKGIARSAVGGAPSTGGELAPALWLGSMFPLHSAALGD